MKKADLILTSILMAILIMTVSLCGCGGVNSKLAGEITNVTSDDGVHFSCEYKGMTREYTIYFPGDISENAPDKAKGSVLLIALHGYGSDGDSFARDTGLHEALCPKGYTLVYPNGIPDPDDKTAATGWNSGLKETGNDDAGFLSALACYLEKEYSLSTKQCVAAGFSNGAFMTHRLAIDGNKVFTDIVSDAGMMPQYAWESKPEKATVNVLQISGTKDDVVPQKRSGTDKYSKAPAIEDVMEYYASSSGLDKVSAETLSKKAEITKYSSDKDDHIVWEVSVKDGRHSWFEEDFCGFDINELILEFLDK